MHIAGRGIIEIALPFLAFKKPADISAGFFWA
jgi:hypothetical protein